ncbi:hypothetical protein KC332_g695 [Hortaea werneckii]|uniref:Vesicle tethering protein Uso1/P115-like head domain-containing protein n=2 Tax=Hortaea werneckii TaxID=91943 RepID=A0A3M7JFA3_HORWE|nr:hypothetical protein KC350_g3155 [Hortaea werneckii]OTA31925.1 hypothetical protein BTJ68_09216 [Hortaea werneckii EXF-2000]KAI6850439.1 hypothetical protein KC358_g691 [Hortaea werneckii]KAI6940534.1 hypothetical protein KC341_g3455 [Hortaea werneckii]KAI6946116.1 hypothetical protein KC348_g3357 [Hortaea werneckii]
MSSVLKTPPLQTATATIDTLCGRLSSATLLEDRRAAILGLRSFAKQYPASVASGSLRELITTLRRDGLGQTEKSDGTRNGGGQGASAADEGGDVDTIRLVLETLLMLFNPDASSPEAGDEIAFFMADEFSMRQDNILLLLSLLDPTSPYADYYSRLYSVQLLTAICSARPERLQECILSAPLGVSRLVGILDDARDAVRNAGLVLLVDLTSGANEDLRKIVAFEDVYGKVFALIQMEGGLAEAGITAQDCLSLLAHLIKGSASNQTMFREGGCVTQMVRLLAEAFPPGEDEAAFVAQGRERATWGLLQLLGLFLEAGESSTPQNQAAFFRMGSAQVLLDLGFCADLATPLRLLALKCAAALIASNPPIQEAFAALTVEVHASSESTKPSGQVNGTKSTPSSNRGSARQSAEKPRTYVIEALLDLTLASPQDESSLRAAGCTLIQAYLTGHDRIRWHFLQRAIAGHSEHEQAANVLTTLLHPGAEPQSIVFASWIVADLLADHPEAKAALAAVREGNETEGEDVLTSIQALGSQLQSALQPTPDERLIAAYAGLLTLLLWEFATGVNDLLAEGSGLVQALVTVANPNSGDAVVAGVAASFLGTLYEFSTKDSPIPRRTLAPLLTQKLGRSKYLEALTLLRRHPAIRDADLEGPSEDSLLSAKFIDLFMNEYTRLRRAVDKDPGVEILPLSAAEAGVDRDVLDELRGQLQATKDALTQAQQEALTASQQAEQNQLTSAKELQTSTSEVERLRKINEAMQSGHQSELEKLAREHEQARQQAANEQQRAFGAAKAEADRKSEARLREQGAAGAQKVAELERKIAELGNEKRNDQKKHTDITRQLDQLNSRHTELGNQEQQVRRQLEELSPRHSQLESEHAKLKEEVQRARADLETTKSDAEKRGELAERLTAQVKELKEELAGKDDELAGERKGYGELEKEVEELKTKLESAEKQLAEAEKRAKDAEGRIGQGEQGVKAAREEAEKAAKKAEDADSKVKAAEQQAKEAEGKVVTAEKKAKDVEAKLQAAEKKAKDAEGKVTAADQKAKDVEGKVQAAEKRAKDAEGKVSAAEKKAKDAEGKLTAAEKKAKDAESKVTTAEKSAKDAESKVQAAEKKAKDAESKVTTAEKSAKDAESKVQAAQKKANEATKEPSGKAGSKKGGDKGSDKTAEDNNKKITELETKLASLQKEVSEAQTTASSAQATTAETRAELEKARTDLSAAQEALEKTKSDLETLKTKLDAAQEGEKGAKEELESMLLVMGDIEAKRDGYRSKIREMGGEVSEEEEDESEEDEDEDEDEE